MNTMPLSVDYFDTRLLPASRDERDMTLMLVRYVCRTHSLLPLDVTQCYGLAGAATRTERELCDRVLAHHFVITDEGRVPVSGMLVMHGGTRLNPAVGVTGSSRDRNSIGYGNAVTRDVTAAERMRVYRRHKDELHADAMRLGLAPLKSTSKRDLVRMIEEAQQRNVSVTSPSLDALQPSRARADLPLSLQTEQPEDRESRVTLAPTPTPAGAACLALKRAGIAQVSPSHPRLLRLLEAGVTADELADAARDCVAAGKPSFPYVLAVVEGRRRDAARAGTLPAAQASKINAWLGLPEVQS